MQVKMIQGVTINAFEKNLNDILAEPGWRLHGDPVLMHSMLVQMVKRAYDPNDHKPKSTSEKRG